MRRLIIVGAMLLVVFVAVVVVAIALPTGPSDREENQRILEELPVYPGAELVEVSEYPYYDCRWPFRRQLGHNTAASYRAPAEATAEAIVEFYMEELGDEWEGTREDIGIAGVVPAPPPGQPTPPPTNPPTLGSIPAARFVRGTATLHVGTENMVRPPGGSPPEPQAYSFSVSIDAEGTVPRPYCD